MSRFKLALLLLLCGCSGPDPQPERDPAQADAVSGDAVLPERYHRWDSELGQGGTPDLTRYADLAAEGYRALLCVDGQAPDAEAARAAGLSVYHVPIRYGAISTWSTLSILRAARAAPGPLYVYCQHGRHRGPAAAALVRMDRGLPPEVALEGLQQTVNPHYAGLIASVREFTPPHDVEVEAIPVPPAGVPRLPLGMAMDDVDEHFSALRDTPRPELAALLSQDFKEAARHTEGDMAADLRAAAAEANDLARLLDGPRDDALDVRIAAFAERCVHCHDARR